MADITKIAFADDHVVMRSGLANIISSFPEFEVTIQANDGRELLELLKQAPNLPGLILLDINMPRLDGYKTMAVLKEKYPEIPVLALSMYEEEYSILQMFRLGARGYLEKHKNTKELHSALKIIDSGEYYYSPDMSTRIFEMIQKQQHYFTERETEFLGYCNTELTYREIAEKMHASERTVHGYRDALFSKLNLKTRVGLAAFAHKTGIGK